MPGAGCWMVSWRFLNGLPPLCPFRCCPLAGSERRSLSRIRSHGLPALTQTTDRKHNPVRPATPATPLPLVRFSAPLVPRKREPGRLRQGLRFDGPRNKPGKKRRKKTRKENPKKNPRPQGRAGFSPGGRTAPTSPGLASGIRLTKGPRSSPAPVAAQPARRGHFGACVVHGFGSDAANHRLPQAAPETGAGQVPEYPAIPAVGCHFRPYTFPLTFSPSFSVISCGVRHLTYPYITKAMF